MSKLNGSRAYFRRLGKEFKLVEKKGDLSDLSTLVETLKHACLNLTQIIAARVAKKVEAGKNPKDVLNFELGSQLWDLGRLQASLSITMNALQG